MNINDTDALIESQLAILRRRILPNGAVLASPSGHYRAHWVRDGLYVLTATVPLGLGDLSHRLIRAPFTIFQKHRAKILTGIRNKPDEKFAFLHARYHPTHFEEFPNEWGHNQLDMLGLFLYLVAHLPDRGIDVFQIAREREDTMLINQITRYLETLEWWRCPDFGMWEEGPKRNASSIGAVLAGLRGVRALEDPDLYFNEAQLEKGQQALDELFPMESDGRDCDLAQLSLVWPLDVLREDQSHMLLARIEKHLVRERGVIRYRGDAYFNAADERLITRRDTHLGCNIVEYREEDLERFPYTCESSEAEWPLGLAWLSIVYSKLAKRSRMGGQPFGESAAKAGHYLDRLCSSAVPVEGVTPGLIPELYVDGKPNANTPLTWATALLIAAIVAYAEIEDDVVPYSVL